MAPKNKVRIFLYYSYILAKVVVVGGVILLALCARVIVHPNIFMVELSLKLSTLFTIFLFFIPSLFIVCNGVSFFLFYKFLPMKVK